MDSSNWLQVIIQAGAVGICIALVWLFWKFGNKYSELIKQLLGELSEARKQHELYILENNHTTTDLVRECTKNISENTSVLSDFKEITKSMLEKIK